MHRIESNNIGQCLAQFRSRLEWPLGLGESQSHVYSSIKSAPLSFSLDELRRCSQLYKSFIGALLACLFACREQRDLSGEKD